MMVLTLSLLLARVCTESRLTWYKLPGSDGVLLKQCSG